MIPNRFASSLSNCSNSGIYTVGVLTQYQPFVLNSHIGIGVPWDLDRNNGGVSILQPHTKMSGGNWYRGTADAIYQNINYIDDYDPDDVLILSGDHIYKMDLLDSDNKLNIHDTSWRIYTVNPMRPPQYLGNNAVVKNSLIVEGCVVLGQVENSILFPGVYIGKNSVVKNSVIMANTKVGDNVVIEKAIIGGNVTIRKDSKIGNDKKITLIGEKEEVKANSVIDVE